MSHLLKQTSKLSTLRAARAIYFIVAGLAIKQSLILFSYEWPPQALMHTPYRGWVWYDRVFVGLAYLFTVLRYSHGISLLCAYEQEQIEASALPSRSLVFQLFVFVSCMGIFLFLLADTVASNFRNYLLFVLIMMVFDVGFILKSKVVRKPYKFLQRWKETVRGYAAHAALQWLVSDLVLAAICGIFLLFWHYGLLQSTRSPEIFAAVLFVAAFLDYIMNREFYFGGRQDRKKYKIVFVCSPLRGSGAKGEVAQNIRKAQKYCEELMIKEKRVIPLAPHCFYPYFLNDENPEHRMRTRECALAFLHACDAMYVYYPKGSDGKCDKTKLSDGMQYQLDVAQQLGLEIQDRLQVGLAELPVDWNPAWHESGFYENDDNQPMMDISWPRKRVYVCTELRGQEFTGPQDETIRDKEERQKRILKENIRLTLYNCYRLTTADAKSKPEAAFAPQAYYPYFWDISPSANDFEDRWEAFFRRAMDQVKVCDAVYFYTKSGVPEDGDLSTGMKQIQTMARSLGIEIQHRKAKDPPAVWNPCLPSSLHADPALPQES